jgi:hypothetical protein
VLSVIVSTVTSFNHNKDEAVACRSRCGSGQSSSLAPDAQQAPTDAEPPGDLRDIGTGLIARSEHLDLLFVRPIPALATPGDELNAPILAIIMHGMMHCMILSVAPS